MNIHEHLAEHGSDRVRTPPLTQKDVSMTEDSMAGCTIDADGTMWGPYGGRLEYAGQKMIVRTNETTGQPCSSVVLYFTDHDKCSFREPSISADIYAHYSMEVPCSEYGF